MLLRWVHAGEYRGVPNAPGPICLVERVQLCPGDCAFSASDSGGLSDRMRSERMIAGNHLDGNSGILTGGDSSRYFRSNRISESEQPQQLQRAFVRLPASAKRSFLVVARCDREHSESLFAQAAVRCVRIPPFFVGRVAVLENTLERTFGDYPRSRAMSTGPYVRHVFAIGIEVIIDGEPPRFMQSFGVYAVLCAMRDDGAVERIHRSHLGGEHRSLEEIAV